MVLNFNYYFLLKECKISYLGDANPHTTPSADPAGRKPLTQTSHRRTITLFFLLFSLHLLFIFTQYTQLTQNSSFKALIYFTEDNELTITLTFPAPPRFTAGFSPQPLPWGRSLSRGPEELPRGRPRAPAIFLCALSRPPAARMPTAARPPDGRQLPPITALLWERLLPSPMKRRSSRRGPAPLIREGL